MEKSKSRGGRRENAGRKPLDNPEEKKRTRSILLTDAEYQMLTNLAKEKGVTRSMLIVEWINTNYKI